jgi:diphthine synthase
MLTFIGLGLYDKTDISVKGLEAIKQADVVYVEHYTAVLGCSISELEDFYGKKVIVADRNLVEQGVEDTVLRDAKEKNVVFCVVGDVFGATTHSDLFLRAKKEGIRTAVIHNASILTAVGATGLQLYNFGKTTSLVFFDDNWKPENAYDVLKQNKEQGLHTVVLLDIKVAEPSKEDLLAGRDTPQKPRFMTVNQAISQLLELESIRKEGVFSNDTVCIGVARVGAADQKIQSGCASEVQKQDFGTPMHSLVVPGKMHYLEEEFLK